MSNFQVLAADKFSSARLGLLKTGHGNVETPVFMPVGTAGAVKGIMPQQLRQCGASIILANTYHLMLRPGVETIQQLGGLGKFMAWDGPILTDSGGYQVFSLNPLTKIDDGGVEFANHIDGSKVRLDAETAIDIQNRLGVDIIMCFDQCAAFGTGQEQLRQIVERTIQWAKRSKAAHANPSQLLFGIVQGGIDKELRVQCASELVKIGFDGYAIGGLSVGEGHDNMIQTIRNTRPLLPVDKPVYLMGAGMPADIVAAVLAGVDMFDCVLPTRNGRNAFAFTSTGAIRLRNSVHINDPNPIEADCDCYTCRNFSRAVLRHYFNADEMLGPILTSLHNLRFYQRLMQRIRSAIKDGTFSALAKDFLANKTFDN
jgi:queuine tRNA-ribosyltransferase